MTYKSETQSKNLCWLLPRPKKDKYKGGMPLYCEEWLIELAKDILKQDNIKLLNLFCGMNKYGFRIDIKSEVKPDLIADAHNFSNYIDPKEKFDVIIADPPYSYEEAKELYQTPKLYYKKWTNECDKVLRIGGLLIIYHKYLMPNPNPNIFNVIKRVCILSRPYHLSRIAIYFIKSVRTN